MPWNSLATRCLFTLVVTVGSAFGSDISIGPDGIDSEGLGLTGAGIGIGQVEQGRPGVPGVDAASAVHTSVTPAAVFRQNGPPNAADIDSHAEQVAGIMISKDTMSLAGVAPDASLYASAYVTTGTNPGYQHALLAIQQVATQSNVRAVNHSWGKPADGPGTLYDGNSLLTLGLDWSATVHDVLHVVAGNEGTMIPIPTDNFNGMTIGYSERVGDKYRRVAMGNTFDEDADGERTSISLIAPGEGIQLTDLGTMPTTPPLPRGTSYATPHVVGTVALLQEYAEDRIMDTGAPLWKPDPNANARRHEVMKAVLMNSADKLEDTGDGMRLGMTRTVLKQDGTSDWLTTDAYNDPFIPLDLEMGAGHLNARRALQQFASGEIDATVPTGTTVPQIGWDYANTLDTGEVWNEYVFTDPLPAGSFVSITLAWDRIVNLDTDGGTTGEYDAGDTFESVGFNDLDLYLLPQGASDISEAISSSTSTDSNLEHLFFQIPRTGMYEFWAYEFDSQRGQCRGLRGVAG